MRLMDRRTPVRGREAFARRFSVSRETLARLDAYVDLLDKWNRRVNLVAASTLGDVWMRHVFDSAQLVELAPRSAGRWLDLGSGAGLPGLIIALCLREDRDIVVDLVESNARKCAFLHEAIRTTGAPARVICARAGAACGELADGGTDVITARGLAPLARLLEITSAVRRRGEICLFPKGEAVDRELTAAQKSWRISYKLVPSLTRPAARIVVIKEARHV